MRGARARPRRSRPRSRRSLPSPGEARGASAGWRRRPPPARVERSWRGVRNAHDEGRAAPGRALEVHRAAVQLDAVLHDREPQAGALDVPGVAGAMEALEDARLVLERDAD